MALLRWLLVALMTAVAAASVVYSFDLIAPGDASATATLYYCPMHPQVVQDHPGECPICSMTLVPKPSHDEAAAAAGASAAGSRGHEGHRHEPSDPYFCPMHPEETGTAPDARCPICGMRLEERPARAPENEPRPSADARSAPDVAKTTQDDGALEGVPGLVPVELTFDRVQLIGMRKARATIESIASEVRTVGFVTADESRLARVHARFSGWIESLDVSTTGVRVAKGDVLARVFNVELLPAQQEFLAARGWKLPASGTAGGFSEMSSTLAADARLRLELLGMSPREIERIAETGAPSRTLEVVAPRSGHIIRKDVVQGSYIQPGTELFEIADLSRVWVLAEVYEDQLARIRVGQTARVDFDAYPGLSASGKLAFTYPTLSSETRTLRVRIVLDNPDMTLRPGMYANVVVQIERQRGLLIPREALVDTGDEQYVFVAREGGRFEPRRVRTGSRSGDKVEIVRGLLEGEEVVTTGNFLIDSESRLRAAVTGAD